MFGGQWNQNDSGDWEWEDSPEFAELYAQMLEAGK